MTTAAQHASQFNHLFFDFLDKATSVRDLSGKILSHAVLAKAKDLDGSIGTTCLNEFIDKTGQVRLVNITSVVEYVLWVFTPENIRVGKDNKPILDADKSSLRWNAKDNRFEPYRDQVEVDGKIRRVARPIDLSSVKVKLAACNWWDFNSAKPESPYKSSLIAAIKKDIKAYSDGKYAPTANEIAFLKAIEQLAKDNGLLND